MPARSVCLVTLSLSEAGPGRFGGQVSVTDIYHAMPCHAIPGEKWHERHLRIWGALIPEPQFATFLHVAWFYTAHDT